LIVSLHLATWCVNEICWLVLLFNNFMLARHARCLGRPNLAPPKKLWVLIIGGLVFNTGLLIAILKQL